MRASIATIFLCFLWTTPSVTSAVSPAWDHHCGGPDDTFPPPLLLSSSDAHLGCLDIANNWKLLRSAVNDADDGDYLIFCPFTIIASPQDYDPLQPTRQIAMVCQSKGGCIISGGRMVVNDARANIYLWGFQFVDLVDATAIHIRRGASAEDKQHQVSICHSSFRHNANAHQRGAAIRTERHVFAKIQYTTFGNNMASRGGAIYNRGTLTLDHCWFLQGNAAYQGGAVAVASYGVLFLEGNTFVGARSDAKVGIGPIIYAEWRLSKYDESFVDGGGNVVVLVNDDMTPFCNGVLNRVGSNEFCHEFDAISSAEDSFPSDVPSNDPVLDMPSMSAAPSSPSQHPSSTPTRVPSLAPSVPTRSPVPSALPSNYPSSSLQPSLLPSHEPSTTPTISKQPFTDAPTPSYTPPNDADDDNLPFVDRNQPIGYYNFNVADPDFGPYAWWKVNVKYNEYSRYADEGGLEVSTNQCSGSNEQSPMQLHHINHDCSEFHQIRAKGGDWRNLTKEGEVAFSILPSHLRLDIHSTNPKAPRADSPGGFVELYADHVELTTPSLHMLGNRKYDAEYSIYHVQGHKNRILVVSVLVDASVNVYNHEFQKVLNAFSDVTECGGAGRRLLVVQDDDNELNDLNEENEEFIYHQPANEEEERRLAEQAKIDGKFNLYNIDMVPSLYWYAYGGSLPRPPCSKIANWRIVDTPMQISHFQLLRLKHLLLGEEGACSSHPGHGTIRTRPTFVPDGRPVWRCTQANYKSDCERFGRLCPAPDFP